MRERFIERKFVEAVKKKGGFAPKFVSPGLDGMPDRIVLFQIGKIAFVELKAPGENMRPLSLRGLEKQIGYDLDFWQTRSERTLLWKSLCRIFCPHGEVLDLFKASFIDGYCILTYNNFSKDL